MGQPRSGDLAAPRLLFRDGADLETAVGRAINDEFLAEEEGVGHGPQSRGPRYLHRFAHERTLTIHTFAVSGNASLLAAG